MRGFEAYVSRLEASAQGIVDGVDVGLEPTAVMSALNGGVGAALRRTLPLVELQERGAFFTGSELRNRTFRATIPRDHRFRVFDPACGAGDLLLSFADKLALGESLEATLESWGTLLYGTDIEPLFLRAARARLILSAYARGARRQYTQDSKPLGEYFPGLRCQDAMASNGVTPEVDYLVLNPPFIDVPAPADCSWGSGAISAAALILERYLGCVASGTRVFAILPDVLRSGSRYREWRRRIDQLVSISRIEIYGLFDPGADVDVFILEGSIGVQATPVLPSDAPPWHPVAKDVLTLSHVCSVSVGAVVPHRHAEAGPERRYLHTSNAAPWGIVQALPSRRFAGTCVDPPFVAVRRTSSPRDKERAIATIVTGTGKVAVENHLLVLQPHDRTIEACHEIVALLRLPATRTWLDDRIRCRHLTVRAIRDVPLRSE